MPPACKVMSRFLVWVGFLLVEEVYACKGTCTGNQQARCCWPELAQSVKSSSPLARFTPSKHTVRVDTWLPKWRKASQYACIRLSR
eukprot:6404301-Amphidinium_carterae.1